MRRRNNNPHLVKGRWNGKTLPEGMIWAGYFIKDGQCWYSPSGGSGFPIELPGAVVVTIKQFCKGRLK